MTNLRYQRRLAASLLKCGVHRVFIDERPKAQEEVETAVTRTDIRRLINSHIIVKKQARGVSRGRHRQRMAQKAKGRQRGHGSRRGGQNARNPRKQAWMARIRAQRKLLAQMREEQTLKPSDYRLYYRRTKGGMYHSKAHMIAQMKSDGVVEADYELPVKAPEVEENVLPDEDGGEN